MSLFKKQDDKKHGNSDPAFVAPGSIRYEGKGNRFVMHQKAAEEAKAAGDEKRALEHNTAALLHIVGYHDWVGAARIAHAVTTLNTLMQLSKDEIEGLVTKVSNGAENPDHFITTINTEFSNQNYFSGRPKDLEKSPNFIALDAKEQKAVLENIKKCEGLLEKLEDSVKEMSNKLGFGKQLRHD